MAILRHTCTQIGHCRCTEVISPQEDPQPSPASPTARSVPSRLSARRIIRAQDLADLEASSPDALPDLSREFSHSTRYHHEGACDALRLLREGGPDIHARRDALQGLGRRVSVWCCQPRALPAGAAAAAGPRLPVRQGPPQHIAGPTSTGGGGGRWWWLAEAAFSGGGGVYT